MKRKFFFKVLLLICCCVARFNWAHGVSTSEAAPFEESTDVSTSAEQQLKYPSPCYVEKSKVDELLVQMNATVRILNSEEDEHPQCHYKVEAVVVDADNAEMCSDDRIRRIQKNLLQVAGRLFKLATRLTEPSEAEVLKLDKKKFQLVYDLKALRVFYGPSPCNSFSVALFPMSPLIEYVEYNLEKVLALFQTTRPTRPPPPPTPSPTPKINIVDELLRPDKSFEDLLKIAQSNSTAMTETIPKIIYQRYHGNTSTFDSLLNFLEQLPTTENRIIGLAAVRTEMFRYDQNPEPANLAKLASSVQLLNESCATTINYVDEAARSKLADLVNDVRLSPLTLLLSPQMSLQELKKMAELDPTAMSKALSEIVSERYDAISFNALLNFVDSLPTVDNKIFGYSAVYNQMQNRSLELHQLHNLAYRVKTVHESVQHSEGSVGSVASMKLSELLQGLSPLMVIGGDYECYVTNVAYGNALVVADKSTPYSAYLYPDKSSRYYRRFHPRVEANKLVFRIQVGDTPFYASDTNPNTNSNTKKYQTKPSERYVLCGATPAHAEKDWRLVPYGNDIDQFRILSAKSDDEYMFAHMNETAYGAYRRVLLGTKGSSENDHVPNADLWTFECDRRQRGILMVYTSSG